MTLNNLKTTQSKELAYPSKAVQYSEQYSAFPSGFDIGGHLVRVRASNRCEFKL